MMAKPFLHFPRRPQPWQGPPSKGTFFPPRLSVTPISPPPAGGKSHKSPLCRRRAAPWDRPIPWISPHPSTPIAAAYMGEGGTGGKAPKRPLRRPRPKPYDPPAGRTLFPAAVEKKNWLTELVYSASRTIARSCSLLFSSVFGIINAVLTEAPQENHQLVEFQQGGDVNPISEIELFLSKKTFTRAQSILINELLRSKTPELSTLEAVPSEERQESGRQSIGSDTTISASAVKSMKRKRGMSSLDDDFESSEPQRKIPRWTISECTSVPLTEKTAFQIPISEEFFDMDDDSVSMTEEPAFRIAIPEDFLEISDDEDNFCDTALISTFLTIPVLEKPSFQMTAPEDFLEIVDDEDNFCDTGLNSTSLTIPVLEKPSFQMTAPEDLSESDNDEYDLNDTEFSFDVLHAPQTEQFVFSSEWHPAVRQSTSL